MKRARRLTCAAALAAIFSAAASASAADWSSPVIPGPIDIAPSGMFVSTDLNGIAIPSGTYTYVQIAGQFDPLTPGNAQFQTDQRVVLTNQTVAGTTSVGAGITRYYAGGSAGGAAPTTAANASVAGTILWDSTMDTAFVANGTTPLFLSLRTSWAAGTNVQFSNITVTLSTATPTPPNATCATATDISALAAANLTGPNTSMLLPSVLMVGASSGTVSTPSFSCAPTVTRTIWYTFQPPATGPYSFQTCNEGGTVSSMNNPVIGIYEAAGACGPFVQALCSTTACTKGVKTAPIVLNASNTYYIVIARSGLTPLGTTEKRHQLRVDRLTPTPDCTITETEPNDFKSAATLWSAPAEGAAACGSTTGAIGSGPTSVDYFKITTPAHAGIRRHRARAFSYTAGHSVQIMGLVQNNGVVTATDLILQTASSSTTPDRYVQWYTMGNDAATDARSVFIRVGGSAATTSPYSVQHTTQDVNPVALARNLSAGSVTIATGGQTGPTQTDTDMWLLDEHFNAIPDAGNDDDDPLTHSSSLTRTLGEGTYYLAITRWNLALGLTSPSDDDYRNGPMTDFKGVMLRGDSPLTLPVNVGFKVTDSQGDIPVTASLTDHFDVLFYKIVVGSTALGCQAADIADDQGTPLIDPNRNPDVPNGGVNEGDYNAFFSGFFDAAAHCDIADDQGTALPPFGSGGTGGVPNGGVNEGDYNLFFIKFFDGCP